MTIRYISHEIKRQIEGSHAEIERLQAMPDAIAEYEERGWTPDVYRAVVVELRKVGMYVLEHSVLTDIERVIGWINRADLASGDDLDRDEHELTTEHLDRISQAIAQARAPFANEAL